jgi:23S rRNA (guanine2445-N2)-methyltransferase / 23S rRNA (guanine2069-N7)-methyltransferase
VAYRAALWSRTASRILLTLERFPAATPEALYGGVQGVDWSEHLAPDATLAVSCVSAHSAITHTRYAAQVVKDAIVDQLRARHGTRPTVDRDAPGLGVNLYLHRDRARLALDLSGPLHERGYRVRGVAAPLRETLAAILLLRGDWPRRAAAGEGLYDPVCGSGTLLAEAALMAGDVAPGLVRPRLGSPAWKGHVPALREAALEEARGRAARGLERLPAIAGSDRDPEAVAAARENLAAAGLAAHVEVRRGSLEALAPRPGPGLVVANLPYGERLADAAAARASAAALGRALRGPLAGWASAVLVAGREQAAALGVSAQARVPLRNGAIECELRLAEASAPGHGGASAPLEAPGPLPDAGAFANRLQKNRTRLGRWARRAGVTCYRVYDADLPDFAFAVDLYHPESPEGGEALPPRVHVQEYAPPRDVDPVRAAARLEAGMEALCAVLEVPREHVHVKVRRRQRGASQYQRLAESGERLVVREGGHRFLVNLTDRLDTGLFLDHRLVRARVAELAAGRRFLNLFGYTGAATVYAAAAGARTTTLDLSGPYLDWARDNLALNGLAGPDHRLVRADVLQWLAQASGDPGARWDVILLDPPTFSRSKRMRDTLDIQRDQGRLLPAALALLAPGGVLVFSNNARGFRLDPAVLADVDAVERTRETVPPDFRRGRPPHRSWELRLRARRG